MKNLIATIKENKVVIIKRTLVVTATVAAIVLVAYVYVNSEDDSIIINELPNGGFEVIPAP